MKKRLLLLCTVLLAVLPAIACSKQEKQAPTPTATLTQTVTPTQTATPTQTVASTQTVTPSSTPVVKTAPTPVGEKTQQQKSSENPVSSAPAQSKDETSQVQQEQPVQKQETKTPAPQQSPKTDTITCTVSVSCKAALAVNADLANAVSSKGMILGGKNVTIPKGASVYDALVATGISVDGSAGYVSSIHSLGENDCGAGSGWMYAVNGKYSNKGCNSYILQDGDTVSWNYTCDNGKDINATF